MAQPVNPAAAAIAAQREQRSWETTLNTHSVRFLDNLTSGTLSSLPSCLALKTDENVALKIIKAVSALFANALNLISAGVVWAVKSAYSYCCTKAETAPVQRGAPHAEQPVANAAAINQEGLPVLEERLRRIDEWIARF